MNDNYFTDIDTLNSYIKEIKPILVNKNIKSVLAYSSYRKCITDHYAFSSKDLICNDDGLVIIFDDDTYLLIECLLLNSFVLELKQLTDKDKEYLLTNETKDLLNRSYFIYGPEVKTFVESSFAYSKITDIEIKIFSGTASMWKDGVLYDDVLLEKAIDGIVIKLDNGNELEFIPEDASADGYMDLSAKGLQIKLTEYPSVGEYESLIGEGNKQLWLTSHT